MSFLAWVGNVKEEKFLMHSELSNMAIMVLTPCLKQDLINILMTI
jgi:hypothetical protein